MAGQSSVAAECRLPDILREHASAHPEAVALSVDGAATTYGELDRRAGLAGAALQDLGLGAGACSRRMSGSRNSAATLL